MTLRSAPEIVFPSISAEMIGKLLPTRTSPIFLASSPRSMLMELPISADMPEASTLTILLLANSLKVVVSFPFSSTSSLTSFLATSEAISSSTLMAVLLSSSARSLAFMPSTTTFSSVVCEIPATALASANLCKASGSPVCATTIVSAKPV